MDYRKITEGRASREDRYYSVFYREKYLQDITESTYHLQIRGQLLAPQPAHSEL